MDVEEQIEWIETGVSSRIQRGSQLHQRQYCSAADVSIVSFDIDMRYSEYREEQVGIYIAGLTPEAGAKLNKDARKAATKHVLRFDALTGEQQEDLTGRCAFNLVAGEIPFLTREEFQAENSFSSFH